MKKILISSLLVIGICVPAIVGATLWGYYAEQGKVLPSISDRLPEARNCGLSDYSGTYDQNIVFEDCLRKTPTISFFDKLKLASSEAGLLGSVGFVQVQDMYLAGSGVALTATSITLDEFAYPNGDTVSMTDFGTVGFGTLEPNTSREENISFTGITQLASGKATLTGVSRGLGFSSPYTASTTLRFAHAGGTLFRITNSAPFYNELLARKNDETIAGLYTFELYPVASSTLGYATTSWQLIPLIQANALMNQGAATSTELVAGISELATRVENASSTPWGALEPHVQQSEHASSTPSADRGYLIDIWSENDGYLAQEWLKLSEVFDFTGGILMNASSTVIGDFRVDGDLNVTGNATSSNLTFTNNLLRGNALVNLFGGNGVDGALNITTGTTTIDFANATTTIKQYTSINIADSSGLTISNQDDEGGILILRSQGDCTIGGYIDLSGKGATAGLTGNGRAGSEVYNAIYESKGLYTTANPDSLYRRSIIISAGGGGANGAGTYKGAGGNGGGALLIECAGTLTFTGSISVDGNDGVDATGSAGGPGSGGGGGGAAGMSLILYNILGTNTGSVVANGGDGGNGGDDNGGSGAGGAGGAGGGCWASAGGAGGASDSAGGDSVGACGAGGGGGSTVGSSPAGAGGTNSGDGVQHYTEILNTTF